MAEGYNKITVAVQTYIYIYECEEKLEPFQKKKEDMGVQQADRLSRHLNDYSGTNENLSF